MTRFALTRFAPAPTGYLHLGHVLNARYVWELARRCGAKVLLRIEDHDRERCRPEYERALLEDLNWLGFVPDAAPTRQSERSAIYQSAAADLASRGLVYGCTCSRREIAQAAGGAHDELRYPGTCRDRGVSPSDGVSWRVRMDPGDEVFDDLLLDRQSQDPASQCGDVLIRDRLGNWTYQFVAAVDDFVQGVDLVVRGEDLLASTGRQIRLGRLVGRREPAVFAHHELIMKSPTQKLSKSDGDTGVRDLRAAGWTREQVLDAVQPRRVVTTI